ncbi:MAG: ARMT1-like domain-containing protein [bacterium]
MKTYYDCVPCMLNSLISLFKQGIIEEKHHDSVIKESMKYYSNLNFSQSPLKVNRDLHSIVRQVCQNNDPYKPLKDKFNNEALNYLDKYTQRVQNSDNPFKIALKLAIAGNIIDFGPGHKFSVEDTVERVLNSKFINDDSDKLYEEIQKADKILYLLDNTGEIVFDSIFLNVLNRPDIILAVRHSPILNDATMEDIKLIGLDKKYKVITNGDNAPGTLLSHVSEEFLQEFNTADLIISKGQGNYEGLSGVKDKNIFFLLMAKCKIIADELGANLGDFIIKKAN